MGTSLRSGAIRTTTTLTVITFAALATMAAPGLARDKSCARIQNCTTVARPPITTVNHGTQPASRFGIAVKTAPTATRSARQQPGKLIANAEAGRQITCPGYRLRAASTVQFMLLTATPVNITYVITDRITNTTAQGVHFCLAANFAFRTLSGKPAAPVKLPDGTSGHVGLLPACPRPLTLPGATAAPCVVQTTTVDDANSSTGVDVLVRVRVPTRTKGGTTPVADPWGGG